MENMDNMDNIWSEGIKKTKQREDICRIMMKAEKPLSAIEIYNRIVQEDGQTNYAVSTIYRSTIFEEKGFVIKSTLMEKIPLFMNGITGNINIMRSV